MFKLTFKLPLFFLFSLVFCPTIAQVWDFPYTVYTQSDGLPSKNIYCAITDTNGVLWIGTDAGVVRFDGNKLRKFNTETGLPSNDVFEIYRDSKNRLWITTFKEDLIYIRNNKIHNKLNDKLISKIGNNKSLPRFYEDSKKNLWIYTSPFGLYLIDSNDNVEKLNLGFETEKSYNLTEFNGKIYFFSVSNGFSYDINSKKLIRFNSPDRIWVDGLKLIQNQCFVIDDNYDLKRLDTSFISNGKISCKSLNWYIPVVDSEIWIKSKNGFDIYNLERNTKKSVSKNFPISFISQDENKNVWIATLTNGLYKLNSKEIRNFTVNDEEYSNTFTAITITAEEIYAGTNKGELYIFDRRDFYLRKRIKLNFYSLGSYRVTKIIKTIDGFIVATDRGVQKHWINNVKHFEFPIHNYAIKNMYTRGDSLIILENLGQLIFNKKTLIKIDSLQHYKRFYSSCFYKSKQVIGSQDSLYYLDNGFKPYPLNIPFNFRPVDLIVKDSLLIATTAEKGVFFISDSTVVKNLNSSNGLSSNTCYKSYYYKDRLYTASNQGINIYDFKTDSVYHLFESDGLPSNTVYDISVVGDSIYAATEAGLSVIPLFSLKFNKTFPLFVNPIIHGEDTLWDYRQLNNMFSKDKLIFTLNALSYGSKTPVNFYYRIIPGDTVYRQTLDQNILLTFPSFGQFRFQAYAVNGEGTRSTPLDIRIEIHPYFYQTTSFKLAMVLLSCMALWFSVKVMSTILKYREKNKIALETRIRNLELSAWKSNITPHFLFNSLNMIKSMFEKNDINKIINYVTEFSGLLRKTLDHSSKLLISVDEECNYLMNYMEFQRLKVMDRLLFSITVSHPSVFSYYIPSLLIQPVVENSIKHGFKDRVEGKIHIHFELRDDSISCTVKDDGKGFSPELLLNTENSKGIKLTKSKISIIEKVIHKPIDFKFMNQLNDRQEICGSITTFSFPLIKFEHEIKRRYH